MPTYEAGDYVKAEFADDTCGISEWMWVRVNRCDDENRLVFGVLDSVPLNDCGNKLKLGTELAISFNRIREHEKSTDFDSVN